MKYSKTFLLIIFVCSLSGFFIGILNNDLYKEDNSKQQKILESNQKNKTNINDTSINNDDSEENKEQENEDIIEENEEKKQNEEEMKKKEEEEEEKKKKESKEENKKKEEEESKKKEEEKKKIEEEKKKKEEEERKKKEKEEEKKKKEEEEINKDYHIVHLWLNIDNKVRYPTLVFLTSLFENRNPKTIYDITILTCDNINKNFINDINSLRDQYGDKFIKIAYINMKNDFRGAITGTHISTAAY